MTARLASRAGRLRRRASVRRAGQPAAPVTVAEGMVPCDPVGLSAEPSALAGQSAPIAPVAPQPVSPATLLAFAREAYNIRRRRARFLPADLFGEPTWDILLDLYVATRENRPVPTTSACIGAHVPPTTALRWLRILEARGLVEREDDGRDGRRTFVRLSERGLAAMEDWLQAALASLDNVVGHAVGAIARHSNGKGAGMRGALNSPMAEAAE